jgi:hypothetical protein
VPNLGTLLRASRGRCRGGERVRARRSSARRPTCVGATSPTRGGATERAKADASYKTAIRLVRRHLRANPGDVNARSTGRYLVATNSRRGACELNAGFRRPALIRGRCSSCAIARS